MTLILLYHVITYSGEFNLNLFTYFFPLLISNQKIKIKVKKWENILNSADNSVYCYIQQAHALPRVSVTWQMSIFYWYFNLFYFPYASLHVTTLLHWMWFKCLKITLCTYTDTHTCLHMHIYFFLTIAFKHKQTTCSCLKGTSLFTDA